MTRPDLSIRVVTAQQLEGAIADADDRPQLLLVRRDKESIGEHPLLAAFADRERRARLDDAIAAILFVHPDDRAVCASRWPRLAPIESTLAFVVPWKSPPITGHRDDGPVRSFLAPYPSCISIGIPDGDPEAWCYLVARAVLKGLPVANVTVVQLPEQAPPLLAPPCSTTMVIAHRGPIELIETCLAYVQRQTRAPDAVRVAFDEPVGAGHVDLMRRYPSVSWMRTDPSGVGPYVARQQLSNTAWTDRVVFQDSDDVPCRDRVQALAAAHTDADMVGSHELRVDEIAGNVRAIRFPMDVTHALTIRPNHSLFHPTSTVRTDSFRRSGGFSTNRRFASDVQYLLRAFFFMKSIRNVDAFLYVRRKRRESLTTAPETHSRSPARQKLEASWCDAFKAVRDGIIPLTASDLAIEPGPSHATVVPIDWQPR